MPFETLTALPASLEARPADPSDETLAQRARGDPEAFAELYRRYTHRIYRFHLSRTGDVPDAQDLTAQTFLAALENLAAYRLSGSFAGWLFAIARHKLVDFYRRRKQHLPLDAAEALPADAATEPAVAARMDFGRVAEALRRLPPDRADALALRFFGGLSAAEIGRLLDKSEAAAKMLVHRGLHDLQNRLSASETEEK